jgi:anti-sigma factor RsiW
VSRSLTCREFVEFLADYLAGGLPADERDSFNAHLALCPSCVAYMNTYQQAVRLGRTVLQQSGDTLPLEIPEELVRAILDARPKRS